MLTAKQLQDIEQLQKEVEAFDGLELKLNWEMFRTREKEQLDFFHYENDELIAFLGLYGFGSSVEATGMVKPGDRRKGHFTKLFKDAMAAAHENGFKKILLNAPAGSESAKVFLKNQGAVYQFSEHQMKWKEQFLEESAGFELRPANPEDLEMRVRLDVEAFGMSQEDAMASENRRDRDENSMMSMIVVDQETVGKIRVEIENGQAWIYGFSILPEHQGKGIGRKVLRRAVNEQQAKGHSVHLEVETKNAHALGLYETVGFEIVHAQDYYRYEKQSD